MEEKGRELQKRTRQAKIKDSRYAKELKDIMLKETGREYLEKKGKGKEEISIKARFRTGNEGKNNKHWLKEQEKECRICGLKQI